MAHTVRQGNHANYEPEQVCGMTRYRVTMTADEVRERLAELRERQKQKKNAR